MKQLRCEMCGGTDIVKQDGLFVCQNCGMKYSVEEAKKMMVEIEGTVDVKGTVKVDTSDELANLYQIARRAKENDHGEEAMRYYDMILIKDPTSWEASFYVVYFKAKTCKIGQIASAGESVYNCVETVLQLIKDYVVDKEEQIKAYTEVSQRITSLSVMLFENARKHYFSIDASIYKQYEGELVERCATAMFCVYQTGDVLERLFGEDKEAQERAVIAWKQGISEHVLLAEISSRVTAKVQEYAAKIRKYEPTYEVPTVQKSGGCYVATAVYGSYDCPEVWTLRRYRDDTLAETWYGRAFVRTYYAISPTLVKWFGNTEWFKNMWKGKLDRMVAKLQAKGVESTPYDDKEW